MVVTTRPGAARGFTLIELMMVVAIIGILASVAIPTFGKFTLRAKTAERMTILRAVRDAAEQCYRDNGRFPPDPNTPVVFSGYAPGFPPSSQKRRMIPLPTVEWRLLQPYLTVEGDTYYSYSFSASERVGAAPPSLTVLAVGDLDGDGRHSWKWVVHTRDLDGYKYTSETPAAEAGVDDAGPDRTF